MPNAQDPLQGIQLRFLGTPFEGPQGPQGPRGFSFTYRGIWVNGETYKPNDYVAYPTEHDAIYLYKGSEPLTSVSTPSIDTQNWLEILLYAPNAFDEIVQTVLEQLIGTFKTQIKYINQDTTIDSSFYNHHVICDNASDIVVTLPNTLYDGFYCEFLQYNLGKVNFTTNPVRTIILPDPFVPELRTRNSNASVLCLDSSQNIWEVSGDLKDTLPA